MKSICGACGLIFSSVSSFDKHRVGRYEPLERRCLTVDEMIEKKMVQNEKGWWTTGVFDGSRFASKNDVA
jgi:hypothetical protein